MRVTMGSRPRASLHYRAVGAVAAVALLGSLGTSAAHSSEIDPPITVAPANDAERTFVATAAGESVTAVTPGQTALLGESAVVEGEITTPVAITAPTDRRTYITDDSMIAVLNTGHQTVDFGLPAETTAIVEIDGSVTLTRESTAVRIEDGEATLKETAVIERPWAKDATGKSLVTSYSVNGTTLTQHVNTSLATFPVAADPRITVGWGLYLNARGYELKAWTSAILAAGGVATWATCAGITKLPSNLRTLASILCNALPAVSLSGVFKAVTAVVRYPGVSTWGCYQSRITPPRTNFKIVNARNCS